MSELFNGYHVWLGIPPNEQPPNHYRLLGIAVFETDLDVIDHAADRQMAHVRTFQSGRNAAQSQQILNQLATARVCLLNVRKKAEYDDALRAELASAARAVPVGKALPVAQPVAAIPRATPISKPPGDEEIEVEASEAAPLASPVDDDDDAFLAEELPNLAPPIEVQLPRRPVNRDASMQRTLVWVFAVVVVVIIVMLLFGMLQRVASTTNWQQWFTTPGASESAPRDPGSADSEPPPAAPTPAPPSHGPAPNS